MHRNRRALGENLLQVVGEPLGVLEDVLGAGRLVLEDDLDALVEVARDLQALTDQIGVELDLREDRGVGPEEHRRARAARGARSS